MTDLRSTRRQVLKRAGALGATAAFLSPSAAFAKNSNENTQGPEGSWISTVTQLGPGALPPFKSLTTFAAGGGVVDTELLDFQPIFGVLKSPGHGAWTAKGGKVALKLLKLLFDTKGTFVGTFEVRSTTTINEQGDAFSGSGTFVAFDPTGKVLVSGTFTIAGTRIQVGD